VSTTVQQAGSEWEPLAISILADAFRNDPVMTWISSAETYPNFAFTLALSIFSPQYQLYLTNQESGAAIWLPPGVRTSRLAAVPILSKTCPRYGWKATLRCLAALKCMDKHHPPEDHYYLFAVGVRSRAQGQGTGSALLRHVLERADRERLPAYLENTNARNLPLYERHGFEVIQRLDLPRGGPPVWFMWRPPAGHS
jgi:ribosomal protein S18 acetylase RimI-like enzyme